MRCLQRAVPESNALVKLYYNSILLAIKMSWAVPESSVLVTLYYNSILLAIKMLWDTMLAKHSWL